MKKNELQMANNKHQTYFYADSKLSLVLLFLSFFFVCQEGVAQHADTVQARFEIIATFDDAAAVGASPRGEIYVVDQGTNSIFEFDASDQFVRQLGGPGISAGQFDEPMDIDPTNGLILVVADAGNGRIQRFSREFLFLEALLLGDYSRNRVEAFPEQPRYRQGRDEIAKGEGRPIAVKTTPNNSTYAIDEEERVVVQWDQDRNVSQIIGAYSDGEGTLLNPIAIEIGSDGSLFIIDTEAESIRVYDAFGGFVRAMGHGLCAEATAIERIGQMMAVTLPDRILLFQERGLLELSIMPIDFQSPLIDILYAKETLYLLTSTALHRYTGDLRDLLKLDRL